MTEPAFHLAQVNVARGRGEMTDPVMADFAAALPEINALAERRARRASSVRQRLADLRGTSGPPQNALVRSPGKLRPVSSPARSDAALRSPSGP